MNRLITRLRPASISLRAQLFFSFLAVTLLVLSVSSYYSYGKTLSIHQTRSEEMTLSQFRQFETNTLDLQREVEKLSNNFILEEKPQTFLKSGLLPDVEFILMDYDITARIMHYLTNYEYLDSIYIFLENGMVIGGTQSRNQGSPTIGLEYPFYSTPLYKEVKDSFPRVVWKGGLTSLDFLRSPIPAGSPNPRLISLLRGVSWVGDVQMKAVLVFNVEERYFHSSYSSLLSSPKGAISMVNGDGTVISSTLEDSIGKSYLFGGQIGPGSEFGSFTASRGATGEQVIYYRMSKTGWILIHEIPTELYRMDILSIQRFSVGVFVLSLLLIVVFSTFWMNRIMKSFLQLIVGMKKVGRGNVGLTLPQSSNKEIGQLIEQFNSMSTGILELMNKNEETEKAKRQLEIEALQSQINPHFLYNTLNTVKWMAAVVKAPNIMQCVTSLANMLRPVFNDPSTFWSIKEEMDFVKNYANIMNYRYGEDVRFEFEVPEELQDCRTLRFVIQPLIENALIHGEIHKSVIRITVSEKDGDLQLAVLDNCGGMSPDKVEEVIRRIRFAPDDDPPSKGIGLSNVNKRIRLNFGDRYGLHVASMEGVGTSVFMRIPLIDGSNPPAVQKS